MTHTENITVQCEALNFMRGLRKVLDEVSFTLPEGQLVALIGHNGAGKSTLLKLILGILKPSSGKLLVLGDSPGKQPLKVGYLPENVSFYEHMTVSQHLAYFGALKGVPLARGLELAEMLGITSVLSHRLNQCSKGQRQRLGLAQALLTDPEFLILDEPTVGLDPAASLLMYQTLSDLKKRGCTVLVCTHELALVEQYMDQAMVMNQGHLKAMGDMPSLRQQAGLPAHITNVDIAMCMTDPVLMPHVHQDGLWVPEDQLTAVIERLTQAYENYGFEVQKGDLSDIFRVFVMQGDTTCIQ